MRSWVDWAIGRIEADFQRSAETHLIPVPVPGLPDIAIYLKDEASHPTGSLKHRLARSLFLYALCNGWLREGMTVVEASSGSTAVSEAYFARMLSLPFLAIMPRTTSPAKIAAIEAHGGRCAFVDPGEDIYARATSAAEDLHGLYLDQFTYAERATDWRGNNNIAETIFAQMTKEPCPVPEWIVCGAGTGGTSATIGRFLRYNRLATKLCIADPEQSIFHRHLHDPSLRRIDGKPSLIEGVGRQRLEPSFLPSVIDRAIVVSDNISIAAARVLSEHLGRRCGGSTGLNIWACALLASEMAAAGRSGSIVSILCDHGERYADTYFSDDWIAQQGLELSTPTAALSAFLQYGTCIEGPVETTV